MPIAVLVVDDHPLVRGALTDLLDDTADIAVVGNCKDGSEVLAAVERTRPDVVLMDVNMPEMDGLTATRHLLAVHPQVRVVVLTGALTPATAHAAETLGAAGYLLKDGDPAELPAHVRAVASGETVWSPLAAALTDGHRTSVARQASRQTSASTYLDETPLAYR